MGMRARTPEAARSLAARMDPRDEPRIFRRDWSIGDPEFLICARDVAPKFGGWVDVTDDLLPFPHVRAITRARYPVRAITRARA